jgi:hypothetical protein
VIAGRFILFASALLTCGCGYIAEPQPPLLHIPTRVTDLAAAERGDRIVARFTIPLLSTEGVALKDPSRAEVRVGIMEQPFDATRWAASARAYPAPVDQPVAQVEVPAADWAGKQVVIGAKVLGPTGRDSGWSNFVLMTVVPPVARPSAVRAEAVREGVRLTWTGAAPSFRVYRRAGEEPGFTTQATVGKPEWVDSATEYGKTYRYVVEALVPAGDRAAQSDPSEEVAITPEDRFPPAVPSGLIAVAAPGSIELAWTRDTEPDLATYRVYRSSGGGRAQRIGESGEAPNFSDRKVEAGKAYRYAVSAVDKIGNESALSAAIDVTAQ